MALNVLDLIHAFFLRKWPTFIQHKQLCFFRKKALHVVYSIQASRFFFLFMALTFFIQLLWLTELLVYLLKAKTLILERNIITTKHFFRFRLENVFVDEDDVLSGRVFESVLSHGTTFRNEIGFLKDRMKTIKKPNDTQLLILFYKSQMMNEFSNSYLPKIVRVFIEINSKWRHFVLSSIDELNIYSGDYF